MDGHVLDLDALLRARLLVHGDVLYVVQHFPSLQDLAKYSILPIQMRRGRKGNEEL